MLSFWVPGDIHLVFCYRLSIVSFLPITRKCDCVLDSGLEANNWLIIQILIGLALSSSVLMNQQQPVQNVQQDLVGAVVEEHIASTDPTSSDAKQKTVEEYIDIIFSDTPELKEIAWCESRNRHFDTNGNVIRGEENSFDVGAMQINEHYHLKESKKLGLDIYTIEGNLAYAKHLYKTQGAQPWSASEACWGE